MPYGRGIARVLRPHTSVMFLLNGAAFLQAGHSIIG